MPSNIEAQNSYNVFFFFSKSVCLSSRNHKHFTDGSSNAVFQHEVTLSLPFCLLLVRVYPVILTFLSHQIISPGFRNSDHFSFIKSIYFRMCIYKDLYICIHTVTPLYDISIKRLSHTHYPYREAQTCSRAVLLTGCTWTARPLYFHPCSMFPLQWNISNRSKHNLQIRVRIH